jgi:hypothetical protein
MKVVAVIFSETLRTCAGPHDGSSQRILLFIVTAERTSNAAFGNADNVELSGIYYIVPRERGCFIISRSLIIVNLLLSLLNMLPLFIYRRETDGYIHRSFLL